MTATLIVSPQGVVRGLYTEEIPLETLGKLSVRRASFVEPAADGTWTADLTLSGGPVLTGFARRSQALQAEVAWLESQLHKGQLHG